MDYGKVEYLVNNNGHGAAKLRLTLVGQGDEDTLSAEGIAGLRRRRIVRLTEEANQQGVLLSYEDLAGLLLVSTATLKRDIGMIESEGRVVRLKGRRKNGVSRPDEKDAVEK